MKLVSVEWTDAWSDSGEISLREAREMTCPTVKTVGWLLRRDQNQLTIGMERIDYPDKEPSFRSVGAIPRAMVTSITTLRSA